MPESIRPPQAELDSMSHPEKDALILLLFDVVARYEQRLSEVEGKVEKASQNWSKPPSSVEGKEGGGQGQVEGNQRLPRLLGRRGFLHPSFGLGDQQTERHRSSRYPQAGI